MKSLWSVNVQDSFFSFSFFLTNIFVQLVTADLAR